MDLETIAFQASCSWYIGHKVLKKIFALLLNEKAFEDKSKLRIKALKTEFENVFLRTAFIHTPKNSEIRKNFMMFTRSSGEVQVEWVEMED